MGVTMNGVTKLNDGWIRVGDVCLNLEYVQSIEGGKTSDNVIILLHNGRSFNAFCNIDDIAKCIKRTGGSIING